ncbi:MAG: hypothetical protein ACREPT_06075, partial [Rudaea sp.]
AQETARAVTPQQALDFIEHHGIVCEAARRAAIVSLADALAGETLSGNWWSHPRSQAIFTITRAVRAEPQVLVCRLVDGKISFVHQRLWPALVRLADRLPQKHLARVREVHTANGRHKIEEEHFPDWVPADTATAARRLTKTQALAQLAPLLPQLSINV